MPSDRITPILNVSSVQASLAWLESLGWRRLFSYASGPIADAADRDEHGEAEFAGVGLGALEISTPVASG